MVTDYHCWHEEAAFVEVAQLIEQITANGAIARSFVSNFAAMLPSRRDPSPLDTVLDHALITDPNARDPAMLARLDAVAERVLPR